MAHKMTTEPRLFTDEGIAIYRFEGDKIIERWCFTAHNTRDEIRKHASEH